MRPTPVTNIFIVPHLSFNDRNSDSHTSFAEHMYFIWTKITPGVLFFPLLHVSHARMPCNDREHAAVAFGTNGSHVRYVGTIRAIRFQVRTKYFGLLLARVCRFSRDNALHDERARYNQPSGSYFQDYNDNNTESVGTVPATRRATA